MKEYIATWVYLDSLTEKSKYPNNKGDSTTPEFQAVYWRCIVVFFKSSLKFNKDATHLIFTNTKEVPTIDGLDLKLFFKENNIEVVLLDNKYPLPNNYFGKFRNQFFEFSIIDHMADRMNEEDGFLLLDSDCVFSKSMDSAFEELASEKMAITYIVDHETDYMIHGVSGDDMKTIFSELGVSVNQNPFYSGGELLFAKGAFIKEVANDFPELFKNMLDRHKKGKIKFNEEAHVLSYYFYKHGAKLAGMDTYIKRVWTNRNYFRNVKSEDVNMNIWHLPNEKNTGIDKLFKMLVAGNDFTLLPKDEYISLIKDVLLKKSNYKKDYVAIFKNSASKFLMAVGLKTK
ncbi:hypothetical protein [Maribacter stanieri]|uniref:hypothetical protein n=1 Tax=Maribacter stanieri TaxID=440514 RepID=UPI0030D9812B|tara:strand:+ start:24498 stop:25529 length:1032 start_codon:yes stop_codon:yes gene_type:complete